jgi:hypothetical protein
MCEPYGSRLLVASWHASYTKGEEGDRSRMKTALPATYSTEAI